MADTKVLQAILDGQVGIRNDIKTLDEKVTKRIDELDQKLTSRLDSIGASVAYLEDDTPTREEHNKLKKRVKRIENKLALS